MNTWGRNVRLSIFGESHGPAIGVIIDGLPAGEAISMEGVAVEMARRTPGGELSTARKEADTPEILSGIKGDIITGAPLCAVIRNTDARSRDYDSKLRPGHADWTALLKYGGRADMRGGGHFSGRLTAPMVFAGAVAKQILARRGIHVYGRIAAIAGIADFSADIGEEAYKTLAGNSFPVLDEAAGESMREAILEAKSAGDSVGGVIEAAAFGVPGGLGEPFFGSVESAAASLLFSVPAVKAVEFGGGAALAAMRGSEANDPLCVRGGKITALSNHNGGILGGITNGMPVVARVSVKPTPSIAKEQHTVDGADLTETVVAVKGRHDPCIVPRAVPVIESALALVILDLLREWGGA